MDLPSGSLNTESPLLRGRTHISALFDSSANVEGAAQSLSAAGFTEGEIHSEQKGDGYLVTVTRHDRLQEAAVILQQQGGSLPDGDSTSFEDAAAIDADKEEAPDTAVPPDSGISEQGGGKKVGGGVFTRSSNTGGSGSGTATGGSLFGSNR